MGNCFYRFRFLANFFQALSLKHTIGQNEVSLLHRGVARSQRAEEGGENSPPLRRTNQPVDWRRVDMHRSLGRQTTEDVIKLQFILPPEFSSNAVRRPRNCWMCRWVFSRTRLTEFHTLLKGDRANRSGEQLLGPNLEWKKRRIEEIWINMRLNWSFWGN